MSGLLIGAAYGFGAFVVLFLVGVAIGLFVRTAGDVAKRFRSLFESDHAAAFAFATMMLFGLCVIYGAALGAAGVIP